MHSNHREEVDEIYAGGIGALVGMKNTTTGDTLCDPDNPVLLESITFPEPVIAIAVEPKTKVDQEKITDGQQMFVAGTSFIVQAGKRKFKKLTLRPE